MRFCLTQVSDGIFQVWNFVIVFFNFRMVFMWAYWQRSPSEVRSAPASTWLAKSQRPRGGRSCRPAPPQRGPHRGPSPMAGGPLGRSRHRWLEDHFCLDWWPAAERRGSKTEPVYGVGRAGPEGKISLAL
jgi:hypothetical protein